MAPRRKRHDPAARARFQALAAEAQRLGLYRHGLTGRERFTAATSVQHGEEMWRLHQDGATYKELAAISGYATTKSVYKLLRRARERRKTDESLSSESGDEEADSGSEGAAEDSNPSPEEGDDPTQRRFSTPFWAAFAQRTQDQSVDTAVDIYKGRHVHLVRLEGEPDFGFQVEERETDQYIVTTVREGSAAARAGMSAGHHVLKYSLHPMGRFERRTLVVDVRETFAPWVGESMLLINALLPNQAIVMKIHAPDGYAKINRRSRVIGLAKHKIQSETKASSWTQPQCFDEYLVTHDTGTGWNVRVTTLSGAKSPRSTRSAAGEGVADFEEEEEEESKAEERAGNMATSSTETESDVDVSPPSSPSRRVSVPSCRGRRPRLSTRRHDTSINLNPNKRDLICMRFDGETTLGLDIREREMGRFMVFDVEKGGPGARAGMVSGQWLLSYKLYPVGSGDMDMLPSSRLRHELWTSDTDSLLDRHPANCAFIISVVSPDGFTPECEQRMEAMNDALQAIRTITDCGERRDRLSTFVLEYDRLIRDEAVSITADARKAPGMCNQARVAPQHGSDSPAATPADSVAPSGCSPSGEQSRVFLASIPDDVIEPDSKRRRTNAMCGPFSASLTLEFFQAGQAFSDPFRIFLTPEMVRSVLTNEMSEDIVMFFLFKMAQFVPCKRLCVARPNFYRSVVLESKFHEWRGFMAVDAPIVCLPVFDSGRWVLVVVVSGESRVVVNYLDCQNPDGYVLPVCSRITQFVEAAYNATSIGSDKMSSTPQLVVSKAIPTARAGNAKDSGVHVVSYFAAIIRELISRNRATVTDAQLITNACYDQIFSRERLHEEVTESWRDAVEPRICWGRRLTAQWRPCLRLNLRMSSLDPCRTTADFEPANEVAVLYLFDDQDEVQWLPHQELTALNTVHVDELIDKMSLTSDEVAALTPFYN